MFQVSVLVRPGTVVLNVPIGTSAGNTHQGTVTGDTVRDQNDEVWQDAGSLNATQRATSVWQAALDEYEQPELAPETRKQLERYVARAQNKDRRRGAVTSYQRVAGRHGAGSVNRRRCRGEREHQLLTTTHLRIDAS